MTTAVVTGFTVHGPLMRQSFAPLLSLRRAGVLDRILYVTWDISEIDAYVAPALEWPEVEVVRITPPQVRGTPRCQGFVCQSRNLAAALNLVADPGELVFKMRPDFLIDEAFLADKIANFDRWRVAPDFSQRIPIAMPPSPFKARIWVPWADATAPFYMEDAAFMGLAGDLALLANPVAEELVLYCGDAKSINIAHILRFIMPFLKDYPIFTRYLAEFHLFRMEQRYRAKLAPLSANDPYFWHMAVANAWILATSFHVDCGRLGQLHLVASSTARLGVNRPVDDLRTYVVYNEVEIWRRFAEPGTFLPLLVRPDGRLMDDDWQYRLFSGPVEQGFTHENLLAIIENLNRYGTGILQEMEHTYYGALNALYRDLGQQAA